MDKYLKSLEILGLDKTATISDIKSSYRELVQIIHPDKCTNEKLKERATVEFKKVDDAYNYLLSNYGKFDLDGVDDYIEEDIFEDEDLMDDNDEKKSAEVETPAEPKILRPIKLQTKIYIILFVVWIYTILFFSFV